MADFDFIIYNFNGQTIMQKLNPTGNYMFKVKNKNTKTKCEVCSKLKTKTPE